LITRNQNKKANKQSAIEPRKFALSAKLCQGIPHKTLYHRYTDIKLPLLSRHLIFCTFLELGTSRATVTLPYPLDGELPRSHPISNFSLRPTVHTVRICFRKDGDGKRLGESHGSKHSGFFPSKEAKRRGSGINVSATEWSAKQPTTPFNQRF